MTSGKRRGFIDFSLKPVWADPRELWEYLWTIYRIAEPAKYRTKAGDAFIALTKETQKPDDRWRFTGDAIQIARETVYEIVRHSVKRPKSNYLVDEKPPHKYLRRFALDSVLQGRFPTVPNVASLVANDPSNFVVLREAFGSINPTLAFRGFPLIGWTRQHVWFGVTPYPSLWLQPAEVRAAALNYPLKSLPEFLQLPWSPVSDDWCAPTDESLNIRDDLRMNARSLFGIIGEWERFAVVAERLVRSQHRGAPELLWTEKLHESVREAIARTDQLRDTSIIDHAVIVTTLSAETVAHDVHVAQAASEHPVRFSHLSDGDLRRRIRHFPWLFRWEGGRCRLLPEELLLICFLEAWRNLAPFLARYADLRACWEHLRLEGDFDAGVNKLVEADVAELGEDSVLLRIPRFSDLLPTDSPFTHLADRVEDWFLDQTGLTSGDIGRAHGWDSRTQATDPWQDAVWHVVRRNRRVDTYRKQFARPFRVAHALEAYLERHPEDIAALKELAELHLTQFDVVRGLSLLDHVPDERDRTELLERATIAVMSSRPPSDDDRAILLLRRHLIRSGVTIEVLNAGMHHLLDLAEAYEHVSHFMDLLMDAMESPSAS